MRNETIKNSRRGIDGYFLLVEQAYEQGPVSKQEDRVLSTWIVETTYTVRLPLQKLASSKKFYKELSEDRKRSLEDYFEHLLSHYSLIRAEKGSYQPGVGYITLSRSEGRPYNKLSEQTFYTDARIVMKTFTKGMADLHAHQVNQHKTKS